MKIKIILVMNNEYSRRFPCSLEFTNHKYLFDRLYNYNTDLWCKEAIDDGGAYAYYYDNYHIFNTSDVYYLSETVQDLISSNNKIKIDLALNIINGIYKLKI